MDAPFKTLNGRPLLCIACHHFEMTEMEHSGCETCGDSPAAIFCKKAHWHMYAGEGGPPAFNKNIWKAQDCTDFILREDAQ